MANIQDLMQQVFDVSKRTDPTKFSAWVEPKNGRGRAVTVTAMNAAHARLVVMAEARRKFPQGFTFSVRPA